MNLRDPRAFRVLDGQVTFPQDDDVLAAKSRGSKPQDYKVESYAEGRTIPAGRLPASAASVFLARGVVEVVKQAKKTRPKTVKSTVYPVKPSKTSGGDA